MQDLNGKKAVIYARQSYGHEVTSASIEDQLTTCRKWCEQHGITIVGEFSDNNTSSELYDDSIEGHAYAATDAEWQKWNKSQRTKGRKEYKKHLAEAFTLLPAVDFFVVYERTRFFRNPSPLAKLDLYFLSKLKENSVALVDVDDNKIDYINDDIDIAVHRLLATYEMKKLTERKEQSIKVVRAKKEKGITFSNAFGAVWDQKNKTLSFDPEKAEAVRYIFESVIAGKTYAEILHTLNSKYIHLAIGKCFYESSIYNIIRNLSYTGMRKSENGSIIQCINVSNPPVNYLQWKKANEIMADKKEKSGRQKYNVRGKAKRHFLPLSGYLKCGHCGSKLVMVNDKGIVYFCKKTILLHDKKCTESRIRITQGDNDLLLTLQALFSIRFWQLEYSQRNYGNIDKENLIKEHDNIKNQMNLLYDQLTKFNLSEDIFKSRLEENAVRLKDLEGKILELEAREKSNDEERILKLRDKLKKINNTEELLDNDSYSSLLREVVKEIVVYADRIKVVLTDRNNFELPRILLKHRAKGIPYSMVTTFIMPIAENDKKMTIINVINFFNKTCDFTGKDHKVLLDTPFYKIWLWD